VHPFLRLVHEASASANGTEPTVAAVLALQRTGSKYVKDLLGMTISGRARLFHEHDLPTGGTLPDATRPLFDQLVLESDEVRRSSLRIGIRAEALLAPRRYLFVTERDPEERLTSYFAKRWSAWLTTCFDPAQGRFRQHHEIRATFDEWCAHQVRRQRHWYTRMLARPFGLDVLRAVPVGEGLLSVRHLSNTLLVIPIHRFDALRDAVVEAFGEESCQLLNDNSARSRGDDVMYRVFRREFALNPAVSSALWTIPEVRHIHGSRPA
jgi:hypothetical protein